MADTDLEDLDKKEEISNEEEVLEESNEGRDEAPSVEEVAASKGHVSLEKWKEQGKDPDDWVDAKEFVAREPLYKALHKVNRENKQLKTMLNEVKGMVKGIKEASKQDALKELQEQFEVAAENRDVKAAIEIKDKIEKLEESEKPTKEKEPDVFHTWAEENDWYKKDDVLRRYATGLGNELAAEKLADKEPGERLTQDELTEIYEEVAKQTKEAFPNKFMNPNRTKAAPVADSSRRVNKTEGKKTHTFKDLPDDEARSVARQLIRQGVFENEAEYMKAYVANNADSGK